MLVAHSRGVVDFKPMAMSFIYQPNSLDELPIEAIHRERLQWFLDHEGSIAPYSVISALTNPWLTSRAKGIYRPQGWEYALSIKETLNSPYGDVPIRSLSNGEWAYKYHREDGANKFTNIGLLNCMNVGIPVGVIIQVSQKPSVRYFVAGLGRLKQFQDPWFDVVNWNSSASANELDRLVAESPANYDAGQVQSLLPGLTAEEVADKYAAHLVRPNQQMFRVMLLSSYDKTCAMTSSQVVQALEAAHIRPYSYEKIDKIQNGLLLRADVHRLFDRGLVGVNTSHMETVISPKLIGSEYEQYADQPLILPEDFNYQPSVELLDEHRNTWHLS